jgi:sirohydrochlorin ferrochelatase
MRVARIVTLYSPALPLILTAHGSADPRSAATTHAIAGQIRLLRPRLDVRVAFCERNSPSLGAVLRELDEPAVVAPLLLASAFHARTDIPAMIDAAGADDVHQAETLGEDPRLIRVLRERLAEAGVAAHAGRTGVLVVAVGSSHANANARTAMVGTALARCGRWSVEVAYATGPEPSVAAGIDRLRDRGARRIILAPWFIAPGRITDRVAAIAAAERLEITAPLGAHPLVAETVLDRFDAAVAAKAAAA